jgi:hypothetical protein
MDQLSWVELSLTLHGCRDQVVRSATSPRPSKQVIRSLHVEARQNCGHDPDNAFAALVHAPKV